MLLLQSWCRAGIPVVPADSVLFEDDWAGIPTGVITSGNWESTFGLQTRGWESVSLFNNPEVLARAGMPSEALAASECPAGKTRFMYYPQDGDEWLATINWAPLVGLDEVYASWWEFRPPADDGAVNKACRIKTDEHDFILEYQMGSPTVASTVMYQNSAGGFPGTIGYGGIDPWNNNTWRHIEYYIKRSASTSAEDGEAKLWVDGVLNLEGTARWNSDATDAAAKINQVCIGGWPSAGGLGGTPPWPRYIGAVKISSERLGVWDMT